jgi:outer membrane protein TolC
MLTDPASRFWNAGPQLTLPLFAGGRLREQVKAAEAQRDAALASYRKAVLVAFADVESALARCRDDHDRAQRLQAAQATQARQLGFAQQRVQVGDSAQTEALGTDLAAAALDDQVLAAHQALAGDLVALYKALGGPPGPADAAK